MYHAKTVSDLSKHFVYWLQRGLVLKPRSTCWLCFCDFASVYYTRPAHTKCWWLRPWVDRCTAARQEEPWSFIRAPRNTNKRQSPLRFFLVGSLPKVNTWTNMGICTTNTGATFSLLRWRWCRYEQVEQGLSIFAYANTCDMHTSASYCALFITLLFRSFWY